jgi:hypothetical protein
MIIIYSKCSCCGEVDKMGIQVDVCNACKTISKQFGISNFKLIKDKKLELKKKKRFGQG